MPRGGEQPRRLEKKGRKSLQEGEEREGPALLLALEDEKGAIRRRSRAIS